MNRSFLERLENAFGKANDLSAPDAQAEFIRKVAKDDPAVADELRMLLEIRADADRMFAPDRDHFSLLLTSLGDSKRTESGQELLEFLRSVSEPKHVGELASFRGYSLQELVGIGATAFVFRGRDRRLDRDVAIKVLAPSIAANTTRRQAFCQEARLASTVCHPNVVTIHHVSDEQESSLVFYVMDWADGVLLQDLIDTSSFPTDQAVELLRQLAEGLDDIHQCGIIHRDLKPGNLVVNHEGTHLTILDFGLAFDYHLDNGADKMAGTPLYMSPEQLQGKDLTHHTDLFSLAEIACVLLFGRHPYAATSVTELSNLVLGGEPLIDTSNAELATVLSKGLSSQPLQRFTTATSFVCACAAALTDSAPHKPIFDSSPAIPISGRSRSRQFAWRYFFVTTFLAAVTLLLWNRGSDTSVSVDNKNVSPPLEQITKPTGAWEDSDHYRNFIGMKFLRLPYIESAISTWPPDPAYPELFRNLGWSNLRRDLLVGSQLVTKRQYLQVMGQLPPNVSIKDATLDAPVTQVSFQDASEFCVRLTAIDPDSNKYRVCGVNSWTLANYGYSILQGKTDAARVMKTFKNLSRGDSKSLQPLPSLPLIEDTFGSLWEWMANEVRNPPNMEGVVSYKMIPEIPRVPFHQVLGAVTNDILVHAHDMNYGMNAHYTSSKNLQLHVEEDGETRYLHPILPGQEASLRYRYSCAQPMLEARVLIPFRLHLKNTSAGIRIRCRTLDEPALETCKWTEVFRTSGPWIRGLDNLEFVDLTSWVQEATETELEYWMKADDSPMHHTQLGRTTHTLSMPDVFCFEAVTTGRGESPRQYVGVPVNYQSSRIGFRTEIGLSSD